MLPNNTRRPYKLIMLGLAALLILLLTACGGNNKDNAENTGKDNTGKSEPASDKIIATYEGGTVTEVDFAKYTGTRKLIDESYMYLEMMPDFKNMVLNQLIAERVLVKDVTKEVEEQSAEQANTVTDNMKTSIEANPEQKTGIEEFMKSYGLSFDDLNDYVKSQYKIQSVLSAKYTDADVENKYNENIKADKNAYTKATVRHVLVAFKDQEGKEIRTKEEALARANEAYDKLKATGDWDKLALEYSDDGNKDSGGIYEDADVNSWVANFKDAALNQPINEIGRPIETTFGYHVVVVEKRTAGDFASVKNAVQSEMINDYFLDYIQNEVPKLIIGEVHFPEEPTPEAPTDGADIGTEPAPEKTE